MSLRSLRRDWSETPLLQRYWIIMVFGWSFSMLWVIPFGTTTQWGICLAAQIVSMVGFFVVLRRLPHE